MKLFQLTLVPADGGTVGQHMGLIFLCSGKFTPVLSLRRVKSYTRAGRSQSGCRTCLSILMVRPPLDLETMPRTANTEEAAVLSVQCAADRTQLALIRDPPQNTDMGRLVERVRAACQGASPGTRSTPFTILVEFAPTKPPKPFDLERPVRPQGSQTANDN